jgi:hypothetical protein
VLIIKAHQGNMAICSRSFVDIDHQATNATQAAGKKETIPGATHGSSIHCHCHGNLRIASSTSISSSSH